MKKALMKAFKDAKRYGLGIVDSKTKTCISAEHLIFVWPDGKAKKPKDNVVLQRDLIAIEKIYKEKFGKQDPYEIRLHTMDEDKFIDRMIRATEICTLQYVLNKGGSLNKSRATITRGRKKFLWED